MRYLSVCSGIEAASVAWEPLGWEPVAFSEVEKFPCSVLAHRFPGVSNLGDMTRYQEWDLARSVDLVCGGTPCQSFSLGGLRGGLQDDRGNLALVYFRIVEELRPRWVLWENVPGVLSSNGGRDFGSIVGALGQLGYGYAWRVLDARHFGCASPRPRVFVVGYLGDWRPPADVLLLGEGVGGTEAAVPEKRKVISPPVLTRTGAMAADDRTPCILDGGTARRATPLEWERAMGFPDNWTLVPHRGKPAADGPRYKAIGNSMAVPCMRWIGERIQATDRHA